MNNNELLRRFRSSLNLGDAEMIEIFKLSGGAMNQATLLMLLKQEDEDDFIPCANPLMSFFLDGLIVHKRGPREPAAGRVQQPDAALDNNAILKKLRIALDLKEADMLAIMTLAGVSVSKSELGALFRTRGNRHYKACDDRFLQNFLYGLAKRCQGTAAGQEAR